MSVAEVGSHARETFAVPNASPASADCLICGGTTHESLHVPGDWRRPNQGEPYNIVRCPTCGFRQLDPRPSSQELAAAYNLETYYTHYAPREVRPLGGVCERVRVGLAWRADRGVEAEIDAGTLARYGLRPGAAVCDIGCGNGGLLRRLRTAGYAVVGIEPDDDARESARQAELTVYAGSAEQRPPGLYDARFDVVTMTHVLEHCLDPVAAVHNAAGLLESGGLFFVETPNNACRGARRAGAAWRWLDVPRHVNFFTPNSLQQICRHAGLEIAAVEYTGYTRQFHTEWLAEEREIAHRLTGAKPGACRTFWNTAALFAATCCAPPEQKYDSMRVIARRP